MGLGDVVYYLMPGLMMMGVAALYPIQRRRLAKKTSSWVDVAGVVLSVRVVVSGEELEAVVDVMYKFSGKTFYKYKVFTGGKATGEFPLGSAIALLVDPENPQDCLAKREVDQIVG